MRKHYKLVSSIACIVLCIAIVAFGVYAASNSLVKLSATVSFTPTMAKLTIRGGIANAVDNTGSKPETYGYYDSNKDDTTESGNTYTFKTWSYGTALFDNANVDQAEPIYFFIQITNHVENNINILVKFKTDFSTNTNLKVSYYYKEQLTTSIDSNTIGMYGISGSEEPTQGTTNGLVSAYSQATTTFNSITYNTASDEAEISETGTSLSTAMLVIKLEVINQAENVVLGENDAFNFVVDVKNVGTNKE